MTADPKRFSLEWCRRIPFMAHRKVQASQDRRRSEYKQGVVREYGRRFGLRVLVETGTFLGDTVAASRGHFQRIYSVELSRELARSARERFKGDAQVIILEGDSEMVLPTLLSELREPSLFWLDGHYSGGVTALGTSVTPVLSELKMILTHPIKGHVILVDDARAFGRAEGYPTLDDLRVLTAGRHDLTLAIQNDIIRLHPLRPSSSDD